MGIFTLHMYSGAIWRVNTIHSVDQNFRSMDFFSFTLKKSFKFFIVVRICDVRAVLFKFPVYIIVDYRSSNLQQNSRTCSPCLMNFIPVD